MVSEQLPLFTEEVGTWPYPEPCPIRETCPPYNCETGGCGGEFALCVAAQLASGRWMDESAWRMLSGYTRRKYEELIA